MSKFHTVRESGQAHIVDGQLRFLSNNGFDVRVKLMLLNEKKNRNGWVYENIREHLAEFVGTPLLISYKDGQLGAGHEMDEIINADGTVSQSFMSATAERIVGVIPDRSSVAIETIDGVEWVTAEAIIFGWYAPELVKRLKGTGNLSSDEKRKRAMKVSIETLIDEMYTRDDGTEVFTKYRVLGTTILSDNVREAVAGAKVRALSAIGFDRIQEMTRLRVASVKSETQNNQPSENFLEKGEKKMKVKDLVAKFPEFTVVGINGKNVALLSAQNVPYVSTAERQGDEVICGAKTEVEAKVVFSNGEIQVDVPLETIVEKNNEVIAALRQELEEEKTARKNADATVDRMIKAEVTRRREEIKRALRGRFGKVNENRTMKVDESVVEEFMTESRIEEYVELEDCDGKFIGAERACRDLDAACMEHIIEFDKETARMNAEKKSRMAWDLGNAQNDKGEPSAIEAALARIQK